MSCQTNSMNCSCPRSEPWEAQMRGHCVNSYHSAIRMLFARLVPIHRRTNDYFALRCSKRCLSTSPLPKGSSWREFHRTSGRQRVQRREDIWPKSWKLSILHQKKWWKCNSRRREILLKPGPTIYHRCYSKVERERVARRLA